MTLMTCEPEDKSEFLVDRCYSQREHRTVRFWISWSKSQIETQTCLPHNKWMKTIQQDLKSMNLSLNEAIDVAQNRPLWRLMSTFGTMHS